MGYSRRLIATTPVDTKAGKIGLTVRLVRAEDLAAYIARWEKLASSATLPNPFFEPFMLLPAIAHLGTSSDKLRFVLVLGTENASGEAPLLGFFPLEIRRSCMHVPVRNLALWQHRYCYLTVPLIEAGREWQVLDAFWRWFEHNPLGCRLLDTNYLPLDAAFHDVWSDFAIGRASFAVNEHPRALLVAEGTAEDYLARMISHKHAHEHKRLIRRLQDYGEIQYQRLTKEEDVEAWISDFLRLEASGWKGTDAGDAIAKQAGNIEFVREMTRVGFKAGKVMMLAMSVGGKRIAMKYNAVSRHTAFGYKIAFDESFAKWSPGFLLEIQHIREVFADENLRDMDSCAMPRHPMADRIFDRRRMIRRTVFSNGSRFGDLLVSIMPMLRWGRSQVRPDAVMPYLQISTKARSA